MSVTPAPEAAATEAEVVTMALLRAADALGIRNNVLAAIVGVSESTVSRMRRGGYRLARNQKALELAVLFLRLYRSLDAIVGGDDSVASAWLRNRNLALGAAPLDRIQTISGLVDVIDYLDARRAVG